MLNELRFVGRLPLGSWQAFFLLAAAWTYPVSGQGPPSENEGGAAADNADDSRTPLNVIEGVVVTKSDGKPQGKVTISFAHNKNGYIMIDADGLTQLIDVSQHAENAPTRNHKAVIKTRTDENGHFSLKSFVFWSDEYTLLASTKSRGTAIVRRLVPENYRNKPLRVELEPAASIKVVVPRFRIPRGMSPMIGLRAYRDSLADDADGSPGDDENYLRISYSSAESNSVRMAEFERLVPGISYRVTVALSKTGMAFTPTALEQVVCPRAGETIELFSDPSKDKSLPQNVTVAGMVTGVDDKPLKNVNVRLSHRGGGRQAVIGVVTDSDGHYQIGYVPPGKYRLELEHRRERTAPG